MLVDWSCTHIACKVWKKNAWVNNKYSKLVARVKRFINSVKNLSVNASCKDCLKGISNQVTEHPGEQASNESIRKVLKQGLETVKSCMFSFQFPLFLIGLWWSYFPEWCYDPECESKHTPCYIYLLEIPTPSKLIGFHLWFQSNEVSSITVLAFLSLEALDKKCRLLLEQEWHSQPHLTFFKATARFGATQSQCTLPQMFSPFVGQKTWHQLFILAALHDIYTNVDKRKMVCTGGGSSQAHLFHVTTLL